MHSDTNNKISFKQYLQQSWSLSKGSTKGYKIIMLTVFFVSFIFNLSMMQSIQSSELIERQAIWINSLVDPLSLLLLCHFMIRPYLRFKMLQGPLRLSGLFKLCLFLLINSMVYFSINMLLTEMGSFSGADIKRLQFVTDDGEVDAVVGQGTIWFMGIMNGFSFFAAWSIAYMLWHQHLARKILQQQVHKAQMQQLTNQLSPHFLFNTFNSIRALIYEDQDKAAETVTELSELFRIHMQAHLRTGSTLEEEWKIAKRYLDIEQIRLEERLTFTIDVEPQLWQQAMPTLTLLTLIENAIKHGISPCSTPGYIRISAYPIASNQWQLKVANSYKQGLNISGSRVGLANVQRRLQLMYPNQFEFERHAKDSVFTVKLTLPRGTYQEMPNA